MKSLSFRKDLVGVQEELLRFAGSSSNLVVLLLL